MTKMAFVFPGQGSQAVGMGKELYDQFAIVRTVFQEADEALGFSITDICFNGPEEELRKTFNTQPAILTVSVACCRVLNDAGITPAIVAGHSLGEYSALVAAGALNFSDAVRLVRKRGEFMQEAVPLGEGGMAAILGLEREQIVAICNEIQTQFGPVQAVNFNCPGQVVIAGATKAVEAAADALKQAGAKRVIPLPVSAPFHSSLMKPAAERLAAELDKVTVSDAQIPVVVNVSGQIVTAGPLIKQSLVQQAASPVLWEDCIACIIDSGVKSLVEVGPGKVLSGFTKKIARDFESLNIEDGASLQKTLDYFREVR